MDRVLPKDIFRLFHRLDIEIDDDRLLSGADQHAFQCLVAAGVDFLMRHVGRHEDEIARAGFGDEFQIVAPAHPRLALDDVDNAFEIAVMMGACLGVGVDRHSAGPDLFRAGAGVIDRGCAIHARRLRRIRVEGIARDDFNPMFPPVDRLVSVPMVMLIFMIAAHGLPFTVLEGIRAPPDYEGRFTLREVLQK